MIVAAALTGLALLATPASATPFEKTAAVTPGLKGFSAEVGIPRILSAADVARYTRIFQHQEHGRWAEAERELLSLRDPILLGHVLYQRFNHPKYRSSYDELIRWLEAYGDHPGAERIYRLAQRKQPANAKSPPQPQAPDLNDYAPAEASAVEDRIYVSPRRQSPEENRPILAAQKGVLDQIRDDHPDTAEKILEQPENIALLEPAEYDDLLQRIAAGHYFAGNDRRALELAERAAKRSGQEVPRAHWTAALAAWRLKEYGPAQRHFAAFTASPKISTWDLSAGAYWASRAAQRNRKPAESIAFLVEAAKHPRTFYGLLAARQIGVRVDFAWHNPNLQRRDLLDLTRLPGIRRSLALAEIGQSDMAGHEVRRLYTKAGDDLAVQLIGLAGLIDAPAVALKLAVQTRNAKGMHHDVGLYPLPSWQPESGFNVDRALLFAFMRQESAFEIKAKSGAGASGLMQLMPKTAALMAQDKTLAAGNQDKLMAPGFNMELGQRYLQHLLQQDMIKGNLIILSTAYNAGPATAARWLKTVKYNSDPLLFIESIPMKETRIFVEQVLTNFWIYRSRLAQDEPSLDALAGGKWPYYVAMDDAAYAMADYGQD